MQTNLHLERTLIAVELDETVHVMFDLAAPAAVAASARRPLDLVAVIDRSGSMAGEPLAAVIAAVDRLVRLLGEDDRLAVVTFDDEVDLVLPLLFLLIDHQTLLGQLAAKGICELFDGTPISPDTVRRMACDAAIIPMVLGSRGEVLNQGRRIYLPTVAQRHAVAVRDRHCAFPGCRRPAKWTDVHHIVAFKPGAASGGKTDLDTP